MQQVKVPRVEKKKTGRKAEAEGRPGRRMAREGEGGREQRQNQSAQQLAPDCLAVVNGVDGSKSLQR